MEGAVRRAQAAARAAMRRRERADEPRMTEAVATVTAAHAVISMAVIRSRDMTTTVKVETLYEPRSSPKDGVTCKVQVTQ